MTQDDMEALSTELEEASLPLEEQVEDCPDLDMEAEESIAEMREFAEAEAPGTVAYFIWLEEFIAAMGGEGGLGGGTTASGDCETDIAAVQAMVDAGGTMSDMTVGELAAAGELITAISTECAADRLQEFMADPDVAAWMGG
jgi:hypothetical protein